MGYIVCLNDFWHQAAKLFRFPAGIKSFIIILVLAGFNQASLAQTASTNNTVESFTLQQCVDYGLQNQPVLKQSMLNVSIAKTTNIINLSGWMPQLNTSVGFVHYTQLPTSYITNPANPAAGEVAIKTGITNTFIPGLTASQTVFAPSLLYAATSAKLDVKAANQIVDSTKIYTVATVSKAFYNLLLTLKEIDILKEDTVRLARNVTDAYHQYIGGIVDETDYEEATISLNNSIVQLRQANENVVPQYALLKQAMGYPPQNQFNVVFDTTEMMREIAIDTTEQLQYQKRIEYQQLATARMLQHKFTNYNWVTLAPTLGVYFDYNYEYENQDLPPLFSAAFPNSLIGVSLTLPIFTGLSRLENVHKSKLEEQILQLSEISLKEEIYAQYTQALANYRGNLYNMFVLQDNVVLAKRTYKVVDLQYRQGIVAYLNVITAESNLITSEIGYGNALFTVLSSKIDLEVAMGNIPH
jgi:outer membrane protein TolC